MHCIDLSGDLWYNLGTAEQALEGEFAYRVLFRSFLKGGALMAQLLRITEADRSCGYTRSALRQDVLYKQCRLSQVSLVISPPKKTATRVTDSLVDQMLALQLITPAQKDRYQQALLESLCPIDRYDDHSPEELCCHISKLRRAALGTDAIDAYLLHQAKTAQPFLSDGLDQSVQKSQLLKSCQSVIFVLTQPALLNAMLADLEQTSRKTAWVLCDPVLAPLLPRHCRLLTADETGIRYEPQLQAQIDQGVACLFFYGEEGLTACRGLLLDAVVHAVPTGYYAQAVTGLWNGQGCTVYVPKGLDITKYVPLTAKTRLNYSTLYSLWQAYGDGIYALSVQQLYRQFPRHFINIYSGKPSQLPLSIDAETLSDFDRQLDEGLCRYLSNFPNVEYRFAYFDETSREQPVCYDASKMQSGILVQAVKIRQAEGARVISCEEGQTPRQMFDALQLPGTALVSNFLFFMTAGLGNLYNTLRSDRPLEQADAASGHLDYMRTQHAETFPLFAKACMALKEDGRFLFFNYRLGGGSVCIDNCTYRWEKEAVDSDTADLRIYTPYASVSDKDADRSTYRKAVGAGRVNVVILQDKVTCIRKGDVLLPSVGVVLSMTEASAAPLLKKCTPLADGYYDAAGLSLSVKLDPPAGIAPADWAQVQWAYGGGLTLIRDGVGLCDGDHMTHWFDTEGWSSPLSRQTQESNLHILAKHPRTAIGCAADGSLVVLVYSGRTWRSTGADYREMITIARQLFPDIPYLMNCDGGGSAMLGMVHNGSFLELNFPSTSGGSCAGQVRPINTVFYIPAEK